MTLWQKIKKSFESNDEPPHSGKIWVCEIVDDKKLLHLILAIDNDKLSLCGKPISTIRSLRPNNFTHLYCQECVDFLKKDYK